MDKSGISEQKKYHSLAASGIRTLNESENKADKNITETQIEMKEILCKQKICVYITTEENEFFDNLHFQYNE